MKDKIFNVSVGILISCSSSLYVYFLYEYIGGFIATIVLALSVLIAIMFSFLYYFKSENEAEFKDNDEYVQGVRAGMLNDYKE